MRVSSRFPFVLPLMFLYGTACEAKSPQIKHDTVLKQDQIDDSAGLEKCLVDVRKLKRSERDARETICFNQAQKLADGSPSIRVRAAYIRLLGTQHDGTERLRLLTERYDELLSAAYAPAALKAADVLTLKGQFQAISAVSFYSNDAVHAKDLAAVLTELEQRGHQTEDQILEVHQRYLAARMFDEARQLIKRHPHPQAVPVPQITVDDSVSSETASYYEVLEGGLHQTAVNLDEKPVIIAVTHPRCHFSSDALAAIASDSALRPLFQKHSLMVIGQGDLALEEVSAWNRDHPGMSYKIVHKESEWAEIPDWSQTPRFYFLKHGKLVHTVTGWVLPESRKSLLRGIALLGLKER